MSKNLYVAAAEAWHAAGRPTETLPKDPAELMALQLWCGYETNHYKRRLPDVLKDYLDASVQQADRKQPGWFDKLFRARGWCDRCGERYRYENLSVCTGCQSWLCFRCAPSGPDNPPGNGRCGCGGEYVG